MVQSDTNFQGFKTNIPSITLPWMPLSLCRYSRTELDEIRERVQHLEEVLDAKEEIEKQQKGMVKASLGAGIDGSGDCELFP